RGSDAWLTAARRQYLEAAGKIGARHAGAQLAHDADQLLGIARIGGVAGLLDAPRRLDFVAVLGDRLVARAVADQAGVVAERLLVGRIGPERLHQLLRDPVDVLGRHHIDDLALPAGARLDAEQVVAGAAVLVAQF